MNTIRGDNLKQQHLDLWFLNATRFLKLLNNPTKYHQSISKSVGVIVITRFLLPNTVRTVNLKIAQSRVEVFVCNLPFQPSVQSYQVLSIYLKNVGVIMITSIYCQIQSEEN